MKRPQRCPMKGCRGQMIQSETNEYYFICSECGVGIWIDLKFPKVKEIMEAGASIQYHFGLNTEYIKAKSSNNGGNSRSRKRRQKKTYFRRKPLDL